MRLSSLCWLAVTSIGTGAGMIGTLPKALHYTISFMGHDTRCGPPAGQCPLSDRPFQNSSTLLQLKEYPPEATAGTILSYLEQYTLLRSLKIERFDVSGLSRELALQLA